MELITLVKCIGSFILALFIVGIPFICALSYALDWDTAIKIALTVMTIGFLIMETVSIYAESEE